MRFYLVATVLLMLASLVGGVFLIKKSQDNRNLATASCIPNEEAFCGGCINACRHITNKTCNQLIAEECGAQDQNWTSCTSGDGLTISGRCVTSSTLDAALSLCSGTFPSNGCNDPNFTKNTSTTLCFKDNFCGAQQIDVFSPRKCWVHIEDHSTCSTPSTPTPISPTTIPTVSPTAIPTTPKLTSTPTPKLTSTPTPKFTSTPTPKLTSTPTPTSTSGPTATIVPTNTPTPTVPAATNTPGPTSTSVPPTKTPTPTTAGPSPTRIVLPQTGVEFPFQALTILGIIVTLAGFLVLL